PYLAMEFVDGGSLKQQLVGRPVPLRAAAGLVEALARAAAVAHQHGIVHRDLKPGNILLARDRSPGSDGGSDRAAKNLWTPDAWLLNPKIADFGLAKLLTGETGAGQTETGELLGTPDYMAPEQAGGRAKAVGPATDVYALGTILYEL